ncbi:hypothetical protein ABDX87_24870 [Pseudomonas abietaniphila]|uniref:hypothetical protein n=1 Tax=Pseudomonas abietaniphila TaxID=89065 RepID=UPI0032177BBD
MEYPVDKETANVLELALHHDEFDRFLAGEPFYFLETKDDNAEPQNVVVAFDQLFMPQFNACDASFPAEFVRALVKLLESYPDPNRAVYMAQRWIWYYCYCLTKKAAQPDGPYAALPTLDLSAVSVTLKQRLVERRAELTADQRWAGAPWNSNAGLWGPLVRTAHHVRDKLNGPDYVPDHV